MQQRADTIKGLQGLLLCCKVLGVLGTHNTVFSFQYRIWSFGPPGGGGRKIALSPRGLKALRAAHPFGHSSSSPWSEPEEHGSRLGDLRIVTQEGLVVDCRTPHEVSSCRFQYTTPKARDLVS